MKRGFTLIELIVLLAILAIVCGLAGLLISGCNHVKKQNERVRTTDQPNYIRLPYANGYAVYRLNYEGKVYLVNPQGGIVEHKTTPEQ